MCSNSMASAHVILKKIRQRLRVAVSQKEKWYRIILRVICLYELTLTMVNEKSTFLLQVGTHCVRSHKTSSCIHGYSSIVKADGWASKDAASGIPIILEIVQMAPITIAAFVLRVLNCRGRHIAL